MVYGIIFLSAFLYVVVPIHAYAYLDFGTGSYIIQLIIGGALGGLYFFKSSWARIKKTLKSKSKDSQESDSPDHGEAK